MGSVIVAFLAAMLVLMASLQACRDDDDDEKQNSKPASTAAAQPTQQKSEAKEADEDEEGATKSASVAAERPAPVQAAGQQLAYNFDNDPAGAPPGQFHSHRPGPGSESNSAEMTVSRSGGGRAGGWWCGK